MIIVQVIFGTRFSPCATQHRRCRWHRFAFSVGHLRPWHEFLRTMVFANDLW